MLFIIKLFPEITIKSRIVRKKITQQLGKNIRKLCKLSHLDADVITEWDQIRLHLRDSDSGKEAALVSILKATPGIANIIQVSPQDFESLDDLAEMALNAYHDRIANKSFCVRVKRSGEQGFTSVDAERKIGGYLLHHSEACNVSLKNPDEIIRIEIRDQKAYLVSARHEGLGGYPLGSQEGVLSLISGGFDSSVSSYLCLRRGLLTHYCFFNLGGQAHEIGVKQAALHLWKKYGMSHRVQFISVPFDEVVNEILKKVDSAYMGVMLKRLMLKAATQIADKLHLPALATGESIAQVSSQTLQNLSLIDASTSKLVVRPLGTMDKQEIIQLADKIGTGDIARTVPEYCGVISVNPVTRGKAHRIDDIEGSFDFSLLDKALEKTKYENINEIELVDTPFEHLEVVRLPNPGDVVIDIRHPDEQERKPLQLNGHNILHIPFYELSEAFLELPAPTKSYLLYCEQGTMSHLHAQQLQTEGYDNIKIYQP